MALFTRLITLLLMLALSGHVFAQGGSGPGAMGDDQMTGGMMGCEGGGMMMGMMFIPMLIGILVIVALILAILALVKYLRRG